MPYVNNKNRDPDPNQYVGGEGPIPSNIMLIGDQPGVEESWEGRPFVGRSGRLMDAMLAAERLYRDEVYVTNVLKYWSEGNPPPESVKHDQYETMREVSKVRPKWIGLMGARAVRVFLGPDVHLEWAHGLAFPGKQGAVGYMPMYNPAYGLRDMDQMPLVRDDFKQFALMTRGLIEPRVHTDAHPVPVYMELGDHDLAMIQNILMPGRTPVSIDTEGWWYNPWGLSFCVQDGVAWVIHRDSREAIRCFADALICSKRLVRLHNALHDLEVLRVLGVEGFQFVDTMVQAYHLIIEPQGLKPLARRHCGMHQDEYAEITAAASEQKAVEYLERISEWSQEWRSRQSISESRKSSKTSRTGKKLISGRGGKRSSKTVTLSPG